ncbi:MAG: PAS domain S-box protein, partial [Azospira sp.]|nr:PAS domain S-box protein [Azospira sp.]
MNRTDKGADVRSPADPAARLLALLGACAEARAQAADIGELLDGTCAALVGIGAFAAAAARIDEGDHGHAFRIADGQKPLTLPELEARGDAGLLLLPLTRGGHRIGELRILSRSGAFDTAEKGALQTLATDLAFGAEAIHAKTVQHQLDEQLRQLSRALESSSNGVMITSSTQLDHPIVYVNPAFERITGYTAAEVVGESGRFLVRDDLAQKGLAEIRAALRERREGYTILRNYRKNGQMFWNELSIAPVRDESGEITTHFVSIINDVSERIAYEQQLEYHATHDSLTGLANRSLLHDRINQSILQAKRSGKLVGVLLLDLDRFKLINDGFGHAPADNLLKTVAERLG